MKGANKRMTDEERTLGEEAEKSQEFWWMVLFSLLNDTPKIEWDEFEHDLKCVNRFSSTHPVVEVIKENAEQSKQTIKKGQILYRARVYKEDPLIEFLSDIYSPQKRRQEGMNAPVLSKSDIRKYTGMMLAAALLPLEETSEKRKALLSKYRKWQRKRYKGFSAAKSGMPPADLAPAGRINPQNISYLYLSEDPSTCVYEIRPIIGQHVSIAMFKTTKDITVYDLTGDIGNKNDIKNPLLFSYIANRFSVPNHGDTLHYLPTQFLSETIKQMGFEGIRFRSALKQGGINVVLFSDQYCKATGSEIVDVAGISIDIAKSELYQMESALKDETNNL